MDTLDLDLARPTPFLQAHAPWLGDVVSISRAGSGQSNPTYLLGGMDGAQLILRRKPIGELLPSAHAIDREYRVMAALQDTAVPVPRMIAYCEDAELIGAEFFLMERVEGLSTLDPRLPDMSPEQRTGVITAMAQTLGALHSIDLAAHGLQDYGAPGNYFARATERWTRQYRAAETQTIPPMEELMTWLATNVPADQGETRLVHGDYRIDNLLINPAAPHVRAVLDWELSTTGHPLADVGAVLMQWSLPPGAEGRGLAGVDRKAEGLLSDEAFLETYSQARGGADLRDLKFATVFAFFKMAAILQGVVKRGLGGNAADPEAAKRMASYIPLFAFGGLQAAS